MEKSDYERYKDSAKEKMINLYEKKDFLLTHFAAPVCLHKVERKRKVRRYDDEEEYYQTQKEDIIDRGCYFDRDTWEYVEFIDIFISVSDYYLYYELPGHSFHLPIESREIKNSQLDIITLDELRNKGEEVGELLSLQFCDKVYNQLKNQLNDGKVNK
ncbi:MAG: hypothetical protein IJ607_10690 [Bacteroidaceae bacterium]|nr:hypothetical protein [Bacteroidaceae bacterium]